MGRVLSLTDRTIHLDTGAVSNGERLRPLELRLLAVLAEARGAVVGQAELLSQVFGYQPHVRTNTLYTTVHRLREKLELDPNAPRHLLAHRGEGYSLEAGAPQPAPEVPPTNLAPEVDAFVGRAELLAQLQRLDAPLVTLVGPGGAGKTRLAIHHALRCGAPYVVMVSLEDESDLVGALATALAASGRDWAAVAERLRLLPGALLVLDTAEAKLPEVRALVERLRAGELQVRLLVTSRVPLGLAGERRLEVGPLPLADAAALLQQRAAELGLGERLEDEDLHELLEQLDGLPLAIELAAGWLPVLPVSELLSRWQGLASTRADRPSRHQSLEATLDWSWALLSPDQQRALSCLSVLEGRFGLAAAQAALGPQHPDPAALLVSLYERGLVQRPRLRGAEPFSQLHTVRQAVRARAHPPLLHQARQRLADFLVQRVSLVPGRPLDADQDPAAAQAALREPARRDVRAAVALCELLGRQWRNPEREEVARTALRGPCEPAWAARLRLQLVAALRGQARDEEGLRVCEELLADASCHPYLRAHALYESAMLSLGQCDFSRLEAALVQMDALLEGGDPTDARWLLLRAHRARVSANASRCQGRADLAVAPLQQAERDYRAAGWAVEAARMQVDLGAAMADTGRLEAGREIMAAAREKLLALGANRAASAARGWMAQLMQREPARAEHELRESIVESRRAGDTSEEIRASASLALLLLRRDQWQEALALVRSAHALQRPGEPAQTACGLKEAELRALVAGGRLREAEQLARERLAEAERLALPSYRVRLAYHTAQLLLSQERLEEARQVLLAPIAACPDPVPEKGWASLLVAEILRAQDERAQALELVRAVLARPSPGARQWSMATGLYGALAVELGDLKGADLLDPAERALAEVGGHEVTAAWLRLYRARIARATGRPLPPAPEPHPELQRAIDELYGVPGSLPS